jgi:hypothetical protein
MTKLRASLDRSFIHTPIHGDPMQSLPRIVLLLSILSLSACAGVQREPSSVTAADKAKFQRDYLSNLLKKASPHSALKEAEYRPDECVPDDSTPCIQAACAYGPYRCGTYQDELAKVAQFCQDTDPDCLKNLCAQGPYRCGTYQDELAKAAQLCQGMHPDCVKAVCAFGPYRCGTYQDELATAAQLCTGNVSAGCIQTVCSKGPYRCGTYQDELAKAAQLCKHP